MYTTLTPCRRARIGSGYRRGPIGVSIRQRERDHEREARRGTDATGNRNTTGEDPHPQGTHTEGRTPQRTHHRRGGPHRGPTQKTHRQSA